MHCLLGILGGLRHATSMYGTYEGGPNQMELYTMSNNSSNTKIDQMGDTSRRVSLSRTSTWEDDITLAPHGERKGSVQSNMTAQTAVEPSPSQGEKSKGDRACSPVVAVTGNEGKQEGRAWWHPISLFWLLVENWFLIGIAVFIALAYKFPDVGKEGGGKWFCLFPMIDKLTISDQSRVYRA